MFDYQMALPFLGLVKKKCLQQTSIGSPFFWIHLVSHQAEKFDQLAIEHGPLVVDLLPKHQDFP